MNGGCFPREHHSPGPIDTLSTVCLVLTPTEGCTGARAVRGDVQYTDVTMIDMAVTSPVDAPPILTCEYVDD